MDDVSKKEKIDNVLESHREKFKGVEEDQPVDVRVVLSELHASIYEDDLRVTNLLYQCGVRDKSFTTRFRRHIGLTIGRYIRKRRLQVARRLLELDESLKITTIANSVGYQYRTFIRQFVREYGCTPTEHRGRD
jgi:AraC-like DNA-binding protein